MNLTRWEPLREAEHILQQFGIPSFSRFPSLFNGNGQSVVEWSPIADVVETDDEYLIKAELPGVDRNAISVTVENGALTIRGERKQEKVEKSERSHRIERFYGSFYRSFGLPENADTQNIRAESKDGVLNVHVPKLEQEKSKPIQIKIN